LFDFEYKLVYNDASGGMNMGMVQSIRIAMVKRGNISEAELARRVGVTPQNFNHKMKRDNFTETDLREIAEALGLRLEISFIDPATGEKV
jgi:transcriptional regulator with XRE-family HTH domain